MSKLRQFVRQNYTATMLGIIALSVVGSLLVLGYQVIRTNEQIALIQNIAQEISKDQQKQHDHQDERQACFFNIFITYTNTTPRKPITKADVERCRVSPEEGVSVTEPAVSATPVRETASQPQPAPTPPAQITSPAKKPTETIAPPQNAVDNLLEIIRMAL